MVEVWAMNPTPNSMYMAHQYRLLDCKRGFSANKSRKMVMKMFTISVVFFIFCCKFYTFFYVCMLGHCCAKCEWCRVFRSVLADRQQCLAICSQHYRNPSAAVGVRFIVPAYTYSPRIRNPFRIHSRNVCNVFVFCMLHIRHTKVWFLTCKSMVFVVQKGGFWVTKVWFLFFERYVVAIRSPRYGNPSAAHSHPFATHSPNIRSVVAIRQQRIRTP